jgi:hypothetical protein
MTGNTLKDLTAGTAGGIAQASDTCSVDDSNAEFSSTKAGARRTTL